MYFINSNQTLIMSLISFYFKTIIFQKLSFLFLALEESSNEGGGTFVLFALAICLISLFMAPWLISKHVLRLMNKPSEKTKNDTPNELEVPEIKAKNKPIIVDLSKESDLSLAIQKREHFVKNAYLLFRKKYFYGLFSILAYIIIPFGLLTFSEEPLNDFILDFTIGLIVFYFLLISSNFYFYRKQFRAEDAHFGIRIEHPYLMILRKIVNPKIEVYLTFFIIFYFLLFGLRETGMINFSLEEIGLTELNTESEIENKNIIFGLGLILASIFHVVTFFIIRKIAQKEPNQALLILRVFGNKKQTALTFGKVTNFWKHFGSWFTVVDPSFIKRENGFFTFKTLLTLTYLFSPAIILGILIESFFPSFLEWILPNSSDQIRFEFAFIPGMVATCIIFYQYMRFKISRSYAKDVEDIQKKLRKTLNRPRKLDLSFKSLPMFCYANTWKLAVSEFIKNSSVILMDLRGFTVERKGCEYEIDFLLDTFPINQILFLADAKNDQSLIEKTIMDRWEYLREHSPNIHLETPKARIFISNNQDKIDVQSIIDLLIVSVDDSKN